MSNELEYFKGQWTEFKEWEAREHRHIREDLQQLSSKVDSLRLWRAGVMGMAGILGGICGYLASYAGELIK